MQFLRALGLALALSAASLTAGCATLARISGQEQAATYDEKALITAELAFDAALTTVQQADAMGAITPERARVILPLVQRANAALTTARALYDANRAAEAGGATQSALVATAALIQALIDAGIIRPQS